MRMRRLIELGLVITCSAALAYTSRSVIYPGLFCGMAVVGFSGRIKWHLRATRRTILILLLALAMAAKYRFVSPLLASQFPGLAEESLFFVVSQYFLALMVLKFFLPPEREFPGAMIIFGLFALLCAGKIPFSLQVKWHYHIVGLSYVTLTALYCGTLRTMELRAGIVNSHVRRLILIIILLVAIIGGWHTGGFLYSTVNINFLTRLVSSGSRREIDRSTSVGFSKDCKLGSTANVKLNKANDPALRIACGNQPGYLRGRVYDSYEDSHWQSTTDISFLTPQDDLPRNLTLPENENIFVISANNSAHWQLMDIWPSRDFKSILFTTLGTAVVQVPADVVMSDEHDVVLADDIDSEFNYTIAVPADVQKNPISKEQRHRCLQLPENLDPRIKELADDIFNNSNTTKEKILAVKSYFSTNYAYHLGLDIPNGSDPLTFFLLEKPAAHCEYFATGTAILLRLAGISTRFVTGFHVTEKDSYSQSWVARNKDAHAWVEAWDDQDNEWKTVEATVSSSSQINQTPHKPNYIVEYMAFRYHQVKVLVRKNGMKGLVLWLVKRAAGLGVLLKSNLISVIVILLVVSLVAGCLLAKRLKPRDKNKKKTRIDALNRLLRQKDRQLKKHGISRGPAETLHQFSAHLSLHSSADAKFRQIAKWYLEYAHVRYCGDIIKADLKHLEEMELTG